MKKNLRFNRKGDFFDIMTIMGMSIVVVLVGIVLYISFGDLNTDIQADANIGNTGKAISQNLYDRFPSYVDGIFIFLIVGLWLVSVVLAFVLPNDSIFLWISILLLVVVLILAIIFGNFYEEFVASSDIAGTELNFPMINFVMKHFLETILIIGASLLISFYGKSRMSG